MAAIISPCEKIGLLDQASGPCRGRDRNLDDTADWLGHGEGERACVMAQLPQRPVARDAPPRQTALS